MLSPTQIMTWMEANVKGMRRSRKKTLADLVASATYREGAGVLALGRAMARNRKTSAKHCIKRTWRFVRNSAVENEAVHKALFRQARPAKGPLRVVVDWTDIYPYQVLSLALPLDGKTLPFYSRTLRKRCGKGNKSEAEREALRFLSALVAPGRRVVLIGDRGFGRSDWIQAAGNNNWFFVQRLPKNIVVYNPEHYGRLSELPVRRGDGVKDWGTSTVNESKPVGVRLITVWESDAGEPLYLVTNLEDSAEDVVAGYKRRMWIESMFRDHKNSALGLGVGRVRLSEAERYDRLLLVFFLAFLFLFSFGLVAESRGLDRSLKANTVKSRVLSLITIGFYAFKELRCTLKFALKHLKTKPP
jgi:hypothetical protein